MSLLTTKRVRQMNDGHTHATGASFSKTGDATAKMVYKIGDLAREFNITLRTLRFYEDRGLITPGRSGTTRLYNAQDRERLRIALFGKRIGLSLGAINNILNLHELRHSDETAARKLRSIYEAQLRELENRRVETDATINDLESKIAELSESFQN